MITAPETFHNQTEKARIFVQRWVLSNLNNMSDFPDIVRETDRLASMMTGDARALNISGTDIFRAIGNIDEYLASELEKGRQIPGLSAS